MKIAIVTTHAWPIPNPARTGDVYFLDLAIALDKLGHEVHMVSPAGTAFHTVHPLPCSTGTARPSTVECEHDAWLRHKSMLREMDVVHDCSVGKSIALRLRREGRAVCCTVNGGPWREPEQPPNLIVQSKAQRDRIMRGATDYEGTLTPEMGGPPGVPVKDAHVVHDGIDTDFYCPSDYAKGDYYLWLNRWHPTKGYELAIRVARETGIKLLVAGENPANETSPYQALCAIDAAKMAEGVPNVAWEWLPGDPHHNTRKLELYRRAKALLYTTQFQEPFGLSMVEAMACGTPVVATRFGSTDDVVGYCGSTHQQDAEIVQRLERGLREATEIDPRVVRAEAVRRFSRDGMAANYLVEYRATAAGVRWS